MKSRLAKLLTAAVPVALAAAAVVPGPAAASKPTGNTSTGSTPTVTTTTSTTSTTSTSTSTTSPTTTTTTSTTSPTVSYYCGTGYSRVGTSSSYYKLAYDKNANGYVCVKVARKSASYTDDYSQLVML